jgi:lactate racemase
MNAVGSRNTFSVPNLAWYNNKELELPLPENWQVEVANFNGYNRPALKANQIKAAITKPVSGPPLRELARGKHEVVIVFDDQTRVTRTAKLIPPILQELAAGGIEEKQVRFICGLGMHGVMYRPDFVKKLGADVIARFPAYNHNAFANCVFVGTTDTYRTRVYVNQEYMRCDLKILVGSCVPHISAGFGGGGKLILPGVTSFESVDWNHMMQAKDALAHADKPIMGMGIVDKNTQRWDIDECADLAGVDFLVNSIVNLWGESVAVYAGAFRPTYTEVIKEAKTNYKTPRVTGKDVVITNAYAKVNESMIALGCAFPAVNPKGGDVVLIANAVEGQIAHYLVGRWGTTNVAKQYNTLRIPPHINRLIVYNEYQHLGDTWFHYGDNPKVITLGKWDDVLKTLQEGHTGKTSVAVFPDGTVQYVA